jgi:hypothetical protein
MAGTSVRFPKRSTGSRMVQTPGDRGPKMNDSTQDPQGRGGPATTGDMTADPTTGLAAEPAQETPAKPGDWADAVNDPGSGVPGGGRHKYASGKLYCGTEN